MKIRMLRTTQAAPDGVTVTTYRESEVYDLSQNLAELFIREGWAADMTAVGRSPEKPGKNSGSSPENKKRKTPHGA